MTILCGCYNILSAQSHKTKQYLPQVDLSAHTTVTSVASKTILTQTFVNPSSALEFPECRYVFPLWDGVSVVGFTCEIGSRIITGVIKAKAEAKEVFNEAVSRGETAALFEQGPTSDVFLTSLGNIPAGAKLRVKITYIEELKHDMGVDGLRFTLPTSNSPRYDGAGISLVECSSTVTKGEMAIVVDIITDNDSPLQEVRSPSHPIAVTLGRISNATSEAYHPSRASATLALESSTLDKDSVLEILHYDSGKPKALLETHHNMQGQRALMTTLVPKTSLHSSKPEVIFVADQSGSMQGKPTQTLVAALRVFLKSLPVGIKFNICFFGSAHRFLFDGSRVYDQDSLAEALRALNVLCGSMGGTETLKALKASIKSRDPNEDLSVILATDGDIWRQQELFDYLNSSVSQSRRALRVFSLGIGASVSSALIQGVARAGNGFAQSVTNDEKLDKKVVRLLKGALTADSSSYTIEVQYQQDADDDDFVLVERVTDSLRVVTLDEDDEKGSTSAQLSNELAASAGPYHALQSNPNSQGPTISTPKLLQTPQTIPPLYPFNRTTVYILLSPEAPQAIPSSVILRGNSPQNPFELQIPIEVLPQPSDTIHQLAAKKAISELEEGRGWLVHAKDSTGLSIKEKHKLQFDSIMKEEGVRLGVQYQIASKYTSFVAVQNATDDARNPSLDKHTSLGIEIGITKAPIIKQKPHSQYVFGLSSGSMASSGGGLFGSSMASSGRVSSSGSGLFCGSLSPSCSPPIPSATLQSNRGPHNRTTEPRSFTGGGPSPVQLASKAASDSPSMNSLKQKVNSPTTSSSDITRETSIKQQVTSDVDADMIDYSDEEMDLPLANEDLCLAPLATPLPPAPQSDLRPDWAEDQQKEEDRDPLHALIALQTFSGYWELSASLLAIINVSPAFAQHVTPQNLSAEAWATILATSFLERKMGGEMETWEMIVEKAKNWLSSVLTLKDEEIKGYWDSAAELVDANTI